MRRRREAGIPGTSSAILASEHDGSAFRVLSAVPVEDAPPGGFPVLYLLDGGALFGTLVETVRMRRNRPAMTAVDAAIVVGIAHPHAHPYDRERRRTDFAPMNDGAEHHAFFRFLTDELFPAVESALPADPDARVLVGHSLAAAFALEAFLDAPHSLRGCVAISPSIWSRRDRLFAAAHATAGPTGDARTPRSLYVGVAQYDQDVAPWQSSPDPDALRRRRAERRMVDDARDLSDALAAAAGSGIDVRFEVCPGEDHASVVPVALSRSLRHVIGTSARS